MKCSSLVVQALWDKASPLLQLPHIEEDMMKHFYSKRRNVKSLKQLASMNEEDRRSLLRSLSDDQYKDVLKVLCAVPNLTMTVTTEVVDDEEQHVVTAGSIITVTVLLERGSLGDFMSDSGENPEDAEDIELDDSDKEEDEDKKEEDEEDKKEEKKAAWKKPQAKKKSGKKQGGGKPKQKPKPKAKPEEKGATPNAGALVPTGDAAKAEESGSESDADESGSDDSESGRETKAVGSDDDMEDQEWAKFQKKLNKREKALEGRSKVSHSVHCPYFTDDKQEFWWVYISDRKSHSLVTPPYHVTSLVNEEEVELKFTAPGKPGHYNFTVAVRSDSYFGVDLMEDIKLDVQEAKEVITDHPQWDFDADEDEDDGKEDSEESEYATDDDFDDDDSDY